MGNLPQRKQTRLKEYDYSKVGYYFITICTLDKRPILWNVGASLAGPNPEPPLSQIGQIINQEIIKMNSVYENIRIDKYVIMPNHVHMVIVIEDEMNESKDIEDQKNGPAKLAPTVPRVIQQFKGAITKQTGYSIWQKSFYDRVIRNEQEYIKILEYIETNPLKWKDDEYWRDQFE